MCHVFIAVVYGKASGQQLRNDLEAWILYLTKKYQQSQDFVKLLLQEAFLFWQFLLAADMLPTSIRLIISEQDGAKGGSLTVPESAEAEYLLTCLELNSKESKESMRHGLHKMKIAYWRYKLQADKGRKTKDWKSKIFPLRMLKSPRRIERDGKWAESTQMIGKMIRTRKN